MCRGVAAIARRIRIHTLGLTTFAASLTRNPDNGSLHAGHQVKMRKARKRPCIEGVGTVTQATVHPLCCNRICSPSARLNSSRTPATLATQQRPKNERTMARSNKLTTEPASRPPRPFSPSDAHTATTCPIETPLLPQWRTRFSLTAPKIHAEPQDSQAPGKGGQPRQAELSVLGPLFWRVSPF